MTDQLPPPKPSEPTTAVFTEPPRVLTVAERELRFGKPEWDWDPQPGNPEHVRLAAKWQVEHLKLIQLTHPTMGTIRCTVHKDAALRFAALWEAWRADGLLPLVISVATFAPRLKRTIGTEEHRRALCAVWSQTLATRDQHLSVHSLGLAMDVNSSQNAQGKPPVPAGQRGSVMELMPVAERLGFAWGGRFPTIDAMHAEIGA